MARLYADEDFDLPVVEELRRLGHEVLTVQEAGQGNQSTPDTEVLAFAVKESRTVLTFNRSDFIRLHRASDQHKGIVVCTRDPDMIALAGRIHAVIAGCSCLDGQLLRVYRPP